MLAEQDRPVVESQRPEELPLDIADELHLRFDRVAVAYRKALAGHRPSAIIPPPDAEMPKPRRGSRAGDFG